MRLLLMELDNVLYNSKLLKAIAREWAVTAMREAGLPVDHETALGTLIEVVREKGEDYPFHFDEMMTRLGLRKDYRVIAAGVIAYHDVKKAFLRPLPGIIQLIVSARDKGFRIGVISQGEPVKEWEKILRLGIHHMVHQIWIGRDASLEDVFSGIYRPEETIFVVWSVENYEAAKRAQVKYLVRVTENKIEIFEDGNLIREGEAWRIRESVESLLRKL
ncbi:MAG: HAD hydrolase-like protein [Candidatus Korarchaeum sp.]|nr:HAD hydrolase-like protein [Candidatus Korarchaeum sp.]MDW8035546.1 HAD hydrolase-like protein [Candidatus Korarchaeum sp.]